ncbi:MAG TPA: hypothetical protein VN040_14910 [Pseudosphingobacterium sp.]|nr:hypothetical protein [Pseudosphingobacterium sp.]
MKNKRWILLCLLSTGIIVLSSCDKSDDRVASDNNLLLTGNVSGSSIQNVVPPTLQIDNKGFLVFNTVEQYILYMNYLSTVTLSDLQTFHQQNGFQSQAGPNFNEVGPNDHLSEAQQVKFLLNNKGMVQIAGSIIKPNGASTSMLTMHRSKLTEGSYIQLEQSSFNPTIMNRIAALGALSQGTIELFNFLQVTKAGYDEGLGAAPTVPPQITERKFWGTVTSSLGCENGSRLVFTTYYVFWVAVKTEVSSEGC